MKIASLHILVFFGLLSACSTQHNCKTCAKAPNLTGGPPPVNVSELFALYSGSQIGKRLTPEERVAPARAFYAILTSTSQPASLEWTSPLESQRINGKVILFKTHRNGTEMCRSYLQQIFINNIRWQARGKLCRTEANFWRIVEESPSDY